MARDIQFKLGNLPNQTKFYRKAPKILQKAGVGMTNNIAFGLREMILDEIESSMTIRDKKFMSGSVRVEKARLNSPKAIVGSIKRERFSGWIEQETGKEDQRDRYQTNAARLNNWRRRVAPRFRLKPGRKFIRPKDIVSPLFRPKKNRTIVFLQMLSRNKYRQPFFIPARYKRLRRGFYIFKKDKLKLIQDLEYNNKKIESNPWMSRSVKRVTRKTMSQAWKKSLSYNIKKAGYINGKI